MTKIVDAFGNLVSSVSSKSTNSTVVDPKEKTTTKEDKETPLFIQTPVFILFAEILGYASCFLEFAENWCNPEKPMPKPYIKTFLEREARIIYDDMLKTYSEEDIHNLYLNFYPTGLDFLDEDLNLKRKKFNDDLPF